MSRRMFFGAIPGAVLLSKLKFSAAQEDIISKSDNFGIGYWFKPAQKVNGEWKHFSVAYEEGKPVQYWVNDQVLTEEEFTRQGGFKIGRSDVNEVVIHSDVDGWLDEIVVYED